jgi:hypothetical protein
VAVIIDRPELPETLGIIAGGDHIHHHRYR